MGCFCPISNTDRLINEYWEDIELSISSPEMLKIKILIYTPNDDEEYILKVIELDIVQHNIEHTKLKSSFEYLKKNFLTMETPSLCLKVIFSILLLMKDTNNSEVYSNFFEIFHHITRILTISSSIFNNMSFFREIIEFYVSLVTTATMRTISKYSKEMEENVLIELKDIFSVENIIILVDQLFTRESNITRIDQFLKINYEYLNHKEIRLALHNIYINKEK